MQLVPGTTERRGTPPTGSGTTTDGTGWAVGYKRGCTEVWGGATYTICGCYEVPALSSITFNAHPHSLLLQIWCPVRGNVLSHPDDIQGRDASGMDGSMPVRTTCYTARAVFGCYEAGLWKANCGETQAGQWVRKWEQLVL